MSKAIDVTPSPRLLEVLGEIPLRPWQCVAELIDNSLDDFRTNIFEKGFSPIVDVSVTAAGDNSEDVYLIVKDNGKGMAEEQLENSLKAGYTARERYGTLGLFGMGFNIATARLGDVTKVTTSRSGDPERLAATIDFRELQKRESFKIPLSVEKKEDKTDSGTTVEVRLKKSISRDVKRPSYKKNISDTLGDIYSYMLRDTVPGLPEDSDYLPELSKKYNCSIILFGNLISPKLPCIWSSERKVQVRGQSISCVQLINRKLSDAMICMHCGTWHAYSNTLENCSSCGNSNLEVKERLIYGWLGIQRYLDTKHYGIDFIRHGRKILRKDKTVFIWQDPDTLLEEVEYPIEMPANKGRIVGEVHLDHVPVTYQKNDFDRSSKEWRDAIEAVRGFDTLKPKKRIRSEPNNSPLAILYSSFRRNDPGLKTLIPGDGKKATHNVAVTWANRFYEGVLEYKTDKKWYDAASKHDKIKSGVDEGNHDEKGQNQGDKSEASPGDILIGTGKKENGKKTYTVRANKTLTIAEKVERYEVRGRYLEEISGEILLKDYGSWDISVWITKEKIFDDNANELPAIVLPKRGNKLQIFVYENHSILKEYGKKVQDVAFMEACYNIKKLTGKTELSTSELFYRILSHFPDERLTESSIRDRISIIENNLRDQMEDTIADNSNKYWTALTDELKKECENEASASAPTPIYNWSEAVKSGSFIQYASLKAIKHLIREFPSDFLDGNVFKQGWNEWIAQEAKKNSIEKIFRPIDFLNYFKSDIKAKNLADIKLATIYLDELESSIISQEA